VSTGRSLTGQVGEQEKELRAEE